jgi:hypothetical protein
MREREAFGDYRGVTLFYNDVIITVGEPDYAMLECKCHLQNHNKSIYIGHCEIKSLLNLQRLIKEETK